jgi:hypothetical protein
MATMAAIDALPEEMAGIEVASHAGSGDGAQPEHGFRAVDDESWMHFDGDLHAMVGGEFSMLDPVGRHHFVPLPVENLEVVGRPGASDPVRSSRVRRVAGTAGEIHDHRDAEPFGEQDGLAAHFLVEFGAGFIGMQRVAVATERADGCAMIGQHLLKFGEGGAILEHGEFAVRIAG